MTGLDVPQTMEIIRATFRQEVRAAGRGKGGLFRSLFSLWIVYIFSGLFIALAMTPTADPFTMAFGSSTIFFLLVGTFITMEFATLVTGPDDFTFYAHLPVTPRTYVTAKVATACLFAVSFFLCYGAPIAVLAALRGVALTEILGHLWALLSTGLCAVLILISILGVAVRYVSYKRVRGVAGFFQIMLFFFIYGGYAIFRRYLGSIQGLVIHLSPALLVSPTSWGASVFRLASGARAWTGLALSIGVPFVLAFVSVAVVSRSYREKIQEAAVYAPAARGARGSAAAGAARAQAAGAAHNRRGPRAGGLLWRSPEERAVSMLISTHFRHDQQFRMGILVIVPITLLYLAIIFFANRAKLMDPFTEAGRAGFLQTILLYVAIGFFPVYVKAALVRSADAEASWLILSSPADAHLLLRAARTFITVFFLTPYLLALGAVYAAFTGAVFNTIRHFAMIALLVLIETDVLLLFFPELPFSKPVQTGARTAQVFTRMFSALLILVPVALVVYLVYPYDLAYWITLAGLIGVLAAVRAAGARFAVARLKRAEMAA